MKWEPRSPPEDINVTPTHPLAELALLVGGVAAVSVAAVVLAAIFVDTAVAWIPRSLESRIFAGLWPEETCAGTEGERQDPTRELLQRLADHWPDNPYTLRLQVMEDEEEANALALPGGLVIVTRGLLDQAESENELAFVLGHELGHFRHRDHLRGLGRSLVFSLALAGLAGGGGEALPALVGGLTERSFAREQEREADAFGLALVQREYGHVAGADRFFRRLAEKEQEEPGGRLTAYLATHPWSADRAGALAETARIRRWSADGPLRPFPAE